MTRLRSRSRRRRVHGRIGAGSAAGAARGGAGAAEAVAGAVRARAEGGQAERVCGAAQAAHEARRRAGEAQRTSRLGRAGRRRRQPARRLHFDGPWPEDAAPDERRHARVVGDSGRPDSLHDRRPGAVRRFEGLPGAGAVSQHVPDGNGRRSAVAALRSEHRESAEDVSDGREAGAGCRVQLRAGARAGQGHLRGRQQAVRRFQRRRRRHRQDAPVRRTTIAPSRTSFSAPAFRRRRSPTEGTSIRRARSSGSSCSTRFATTSKGCRSSKPIQGDIVYVPKMRFHLASFAGTGPSCRLAMNGYADLSHSFEAQRDVNRRCSLGLRTLGCRLWARPEPKA